jgi:hypothetical protein
MGVDVLQWLRALVLATALLCAGAGQARAQAEPRAPQPTASDTLLEIQLADGSVLFGRIEAVAGDGVTVVTEGGARVQLERSQIRSLRPARGRVRAGRVWLDDPAGTRLFFAPTGRSLAAGEGYFGVYELFFPFATYGVTDRITVAGGTPIVPGAFGEIAYIAPKVTLIRGERTNIGAGVFAGFFDGETAGIVYGVGTWGDRDNAVTAGAGLGFGGGELASKPLLMLGGEARSGRQSKLITENYFVPGEASALISGGIRFFGERLSADAGIGGFIGADEVGCCLPLVNFVYTFGRK